jgi:exonuclease SbcC
MCYRADVPPLEFDGISIACLSGENGAGKSALLDALTWALWGEARLRSDDDLIALGEQEMMVDLTFTLDGQDYRVLRKRNKGRRGQSQLEFQMRGDEAWKVLNPGMSLRETQQLIDQTLRMGFETFSNSAFLRQGHADEFTRKEPSKRKQVLADILGLSVYEGLETLSKGRAKEIEGQMRGLEGQIEAYRAQAEKRELYMQLADEAERVAEARAADVAAAQAAHDEVLARVQKLEALRPLREERKRQLETQRDERDALARRVETGNRNVTAARQMLERAPEIRAGAGALEAQQAAQSELEAQRDTYDALLEHRRAHEQALRDVRAAAETELRIAENELRGLRERAARRPRLEQEIRDLAARLEQLAPALAELEGLRRTRADLQERSRMAGRLQLQRVELQGAIDKRRDSLIATREELKRRVKGAAEQLKDEPRWRRELELARAERAALEDEARAIDALRQDEAEQTERLGALRAACDTIKLQGEQINEKLELVQAGTGSCPLCGNELGHDGLAHIQEEFQRERAELRARFSQTKREADAAAAGIAQLQGRIEQASRRVAGLTELAGRVARLERELHAAETVRAQQAEDQRQLDDVQIQVVKGDYEQGLRAELARVDGELAGLGNTEMLDTEMKRAERRISELERKVGEQAGIEAQIQRRRDELRQIDAEDPALHELELRQRELTTTLEMDDYGHAERRAMRQADAELAGLAFTPERYAAAREQVRELAHWAEELRRLERAEEWLAENEPQVAENEQALRRGEGRIAELEQELLACDEELRMLEPAARQRADAQVRLRDAQAAQRSAENDLTHKRTLLGQSEEAAAQLLEREGERRRMAERRGLFDELTQAFGKKGVQALLIETSIPEIEREANRLLAGMTDNQMHLTFETQGETKKGDVTETLDIKISDTLGTRDYDAYSGGESFRVDFAIRVALAKLLARRAGARLETMVIDEGFGSQDARGRERLVEAITSIQRDFKQILVVTHIQELKDMFPVQIEIVKTPSGSSWSIA